MSKQIYTPEETADLRGMIGKRMRESRLAREMTQVNAAGKIGINIEFYRRIELGRCFPGLKTLVKIADAYELRIDHLFGLGQVSEPIGPPQHNDSRAIGYVVDRARDNPDLRRAVMILLKLCDRSPA